MDPQTPPLPFDVAAATGAVMETVFGPPYVAHWPDCTMAVRETCELGDTGWTDGHALGAAFILWLANAGDQCGAILEALLTGGAALDELTIRTSDHTLTIPAHKVPTWPDFAGIAPADATEAVANIILNPRIAALVSGLRLREDAGGGSSLEIEYADPGRNIAAVYGAQPTGEAMLATERWLSGAALRAVSVGLTEIYNQSQPQPPAPAEQPSEPAQGERFGAVGPQVSEQDQ